MVFLFIYAYICGLKFFKKYIMASKLIKIFLCFAICISFAQDDVNSKVLESVSVNLKIDGMHCAFGCAKSIENALNSNDGMEASIEFVDSSTPGNASITYNPNLFTDNQILDMINSYQGGKYQATLFTNQEPACSKGKKCCQKTGKLNADCDKKDQGCCAGSKKKCKKKKKKKKK